MTECPLDHLVGFPSQEDCAEDLALRRAQLSVRGRRVLDRLLLLLPSHLRSQLASRTPPFPPALLFSICDTLQRDRGDSSAEQDAFVLPSVLSTLRDWRLFDPDYRCSSDGVYKLALDLAGIPDGACDAKRPSRVPLRMKWVSLDSPYECQDGESYTSRPTSPSSSRTGILDSVQECAHALPDLDERCSDAGYESWQVGRVEVPEAEDARVVVSRRHHSVSGFRSGCSACRHLRLSGPSTPPSTQMSSVPFSKFDTNVNHSVSSPRTSLLHSPKKTKRAKHKFSQSFSYPARVDENEPPLPKPIGVPKTTGISFPRQPTHSPRISNLSLSRESFSPAASVQRRYEPGHLPNRVREGDKHTTSHRVASVDLRLSMVDPRLNPASPNDLHPTAPMRAKSFSCTPGNINMGGDGPKLWSNVVPGSRSGKRLPFWSQSHPHRRASSSSTNNHSATTTTTKITTTPSVKPTGPSSPSPAKPSLANLYPFGTRSRPSSTSTPQRTPSDMKHRDRRSVSSQMHKNALSVGALPVSPLIPARKWQV